MKYITLRDYETNKEIDYKHIFIHEENEKGLLSYYVGGLGDAFRTICKIKKDVETNNGFHREIWIAKI